MVRFGCASRGRSTMAALTCFKAGERSRRIYRPRIRGDHRGDHRGFAWQDYRDLLVRAHLRLGGPDVVVWAKLNVHRCSRSRQYAAEHNWLAIVQAVRSGMGRIRRRSHLIDGYLAETGLSLDATTQRSGQQ
ncbi:IS630 family transposase [Streptomyces mirabilis]|uniref:IS630 family transposase n=1 Tax=Streptomyces mirabilis TaxID=68239 RepID=UPI00369B5AE6